MTVNRKEAPKVKLSSTFSFLKAQTEELSNGLLFHHINFAEQDILRLELVFKSGTIFQSKKLIASSVNSLLAEGTKSKNSKEIAELIENAGVFIETSCTAEQASISIYCLTKSLQKVLPVLIELIEEANFPKEEVNDYLNIQSNRFNVNSEKVGFLARNEFTNFLFGEKHPYSSKVTSADFSNVTRDDLLSFFQHHYKEGVFEIFAAGKINERIKSVIADSFGSLNRKFERKFNWPTMSDYESKENELKIIKRDALQTAIRIGKKTISKSHDDFPALYLLNTIIGGFFGSRLMSNLRENKGYTYGVSSGIISYTDISYFVISTEVKSNVVSDAKHQIEIELDKMNTTFVKNKELELVKNYILGSLMRGFDGAFSAMDRFRTIHSIGLGYDYYDNLIQKINDIDAHELREVARKYLQYSSMKIILAGNLN